MDTNTYHEICAQPTSFSRYVLEETLAALTKAESSKIVLVNNVLKTKSIEKPTHHEGGKETDYFFVQMAIEDAEEIVEELGTLEAGVVSPEGHTTHQASHYASLLDKWFNYVESL